MPLTLAAFAVACWTFADLPPLEDDKFWWVPKALSVAELGPRIALSGPLPQALLEGAAGPLPPQWDGGLPDYGHPPLFFHYLGAAFALLGPSPTSLHLALLPLSILALLGTARLTHALAPGWGALGAALLAASPLFFAQALRADLDLPLVALVPFALLALVKRRWGPFAALAATATLTKEPGVLLGAAAAIALLFEARLPPLLRSLVDRKYIASTNWRPLLGPLLATLTPLIALAAWGLVHQLATGWALASPERLPDGGAGFLVDLRAAAGFVLVDQGRGALTLLALGVWVWRDPGRPSASGQGARADGLAPDPWGPRGQAICQGFALTVLVFFSIVGFFGASAGRLGGATHLRYFLPALPALIAAGVGGAWRLWSARPGAPWVRVAGPLLLAAAGALALADMTGAPRLGPERNLFGAHVTLCRRAIAPRVRSALEAGRVVWVGQAEVPDFQFPGVWVLDEGLPGLRVYGPGSQPELLTEGDWVIVSAHGEPPGLLRERLSTGQVRADASLGRAWVKVIEVGPSGEDEARNGEDGEQGGGEEPGEGAPEGEDAPPP